MRRLSLNVIDFAAVIIAAMAASATVFVADIDGLKPFDVAFLSVLFVSFAIVPAISYARRKKRDEQAFILEKVQSVTYESVAIASFLKSGQEVNLWPHLGKIAQSIAELFSGLTDKKVSCGIFSIERPGENTDLVAHKLASSRNDFARDEESHPINVNTVFGNIIQGDRYFISNDLRMEAEYQTTNDRSMEYRSVMAFPIVLFEKRSDVSYQRTFLGFLVLESRDRRAFQSHDPKSLDTDVLYRAGAAMADMLSLVLSMKNESNNKIQPTQKARG